MFPAPVAEKLAQLAEQGFTTKTAVLLKLVLDEWDAKIGTSQPKLTPAAQSKLLLRKLEHERRPLKIPLRVTRTQTDRWAIVKPDQDTPPRWEHLDGLAYPREYVDVGPVYTQGHLDKWRAANPHPDDL